MMQQVNLYTEEFQPRKVKLPLEHILLLAIGTILLLTLVSVALSYSQAAKEAELAERQQKAEALQRRVNAMQEKAALLVRDESLAQANVRLAGQLDARRQMIEVLDTVVVKDDAGYSGTLIALARQRTDDALWLTRITMGPAGSNLILEGTTTRAETVPQYLQNLRSENNFLGRTFSLFNLKESTEQEGVLEFRLRALDESGNQSLLVSTEREGGSTQSAEGYAP